MTLDLTPALQEELEKLAIECESTPTQLAQKAIEEYVAYTRQLPTDVREAEEEADREGWVPHEEVFEQLFARLRKTA
jgi:predicted transcriptional regulator